MHTLYQKKYIFITDKKRYLLQLFFLNYMLFSDSVEQHYLHISEKDVEWKHYNASNHLGLLYNSHVIFDTL